jgi:hypothetical protein
MSTKGKLAWGWIAILVILRNDFWLWDDDSLLLGFLPIGLAWQMGVSAGAALGWAMVVRWAWPTHIEEWAQEGEAAGKESR